MAARGQEEVIETLRHNLHEVPTASIILLDGICPFVGPGIVFETEWDVSGMLRLLYGDTMLRGNVVKTGYQLTEHGVRLSHYVVYQYPYDARLFAFQVGQRELHALPTQQDARRYFASRPDPSCPPGRPGYGVRIF
jgi:hypothetical protein